MSRIGRVGRPGVGRFSVLKSLTFARCLLGCGVRFLEGVTRPYELLEFYTLEDCIFPPYSLGCLQGTFAH